jgi:hypothetical protein
VAASIRLPGRDEPLTFDAPPWAATHATPVSRKAFAAAHVVASGSGEIDWEATMGFRDHLWGHGFALAEAMDTAQRGMGLSWPQTQELVRRSAEHARQRGAALACGAGTDHLAAGPAHNLRAVVEAYEEQLDLVQSAGSPVILMASRALVHAASSPRDYLDVYLHLLKGTDSPVILHWLGDMFDAQLTGYWGSTDFDTAADTVIDLIEQGGDKVDGIKVSVLDAAKEIQLRRRLPPGVRLYTGDDFNYSQLILGDGEGHSDALLGVFAAIAPAAAEALAALDAGDRASYSAIMDATVPLGRKIFEAPTYLYKAGVAFLAWLNGFQPEFVMLDGLETRRPLAHLVEVFELAATSGALLDPDLAVGRMTLYLAVHGAGAERS